VIKTFILVISLWGYDGTEWKYVGNQMVYQIPMSKEYCQMRKDNWIKFENNEYYRLSLECIEK
tara:strand:+ start:138 stop:326 length:189 start_codon:yes stop_codon:yes gene_type:complete